MTPVLAIALLELALPGFLKDIVEALRSSDQIFWSGSLAPRFDMIVSSRIYEPDSDFRVAAHLHQRFDIVFLVERDLGSFKQWMLILDEAMRLLAPGAMLVVRYREGIFLNTLELEHFVASWSGGGIEAVARSTAGPEVTFVGRLTTSSRRPDASLAWSLAVMDDGRDLDKVVQFVAAATRLREAGLDCEILVCGPPGCGAGLGPIAGAISFISTPVGPSVAGRARWKNLIACAARRENLMIANAGLVPAANFADAARDFGGDFAAIIPRQVSASGVHLPDWVMTGPGLGRTPSGWMDYGDHHPLMHFHADVVVGKTALFRRVGWNQAITDPGFENLELTRRLQAAGVTLRLARRVTLLATADDARANDDSQRLPWVRDRYVQPGTDAVSVGGGIPPITVGLGIDLENASSLPHEHGLVLPHGWSRSNVGWMWVGNDDPEIFFRLSGRVRRASVDLAVTGNGSTATSNGRVVEASLRDARSDMLCLDLSPGHISGSGNVRLRLRRRDQGSAVILHAIHVHSISRDGNCVPGVPIRIRDDAPLILDAGWNDPEDWGVWASGTHARLTLVMAETATADLDLCLVLQVPFLQGAEVATVAVTVNGVAAASARFAAGEGRRQVEAHIPLSIARGGVLDVGLICPRVVPGSLSGNANDSRTLSVGMAGLRLDQHGHAVADGTSPTSSFDRFGPRRLAALAHGDDDGRLRLPAGWRPHTAGIQWSGPGSPCLILDAASGEVVIETATDTAIIRSVALDGISVQARRIGKTRIAVPLAPERLGGVATMTFRLVSHNACLIVTDLRLRPEQNRVRPVRDGETLPTGGGGAAMAYLAGGWHDPEPWGVWSCRTEAELCIPVIADGLTGALAVDLEVRGLVNEACPALSLTLVVNGKASSRIDITDDDTRHVIATLPQGLEEGEDVTVRLITSRIVTPAEMGIADDHRILGIGLVSVRLYAVASS